MTTPRFFTADALGWRCPACYAAERPCDACRARKRAEKRLRHLRYWAAGRCLDCGEPVEGTHVRCEQHMLMSRDISNTHSARNREIGKWPGRCPECYGHRRPCAACRAKGKAKRQGLRQRRAADGLCTTCGGTPVPDCLTCADCQQHERDKRAARKATKRVVEVNP